MIYTILGSFCLFLNWEGAYIRPQIRLRKIPEREHWDSFCYSVRNDSFTFMSLIYFAVTMTSFFLIGDKKRRDTVQCIRYVPSLDYYISCSQKGTVALWTSKVCYAIIILVIAIHLEMFYAFFGVGWFFFKINFFKKLFQEYHFSVKQIGSRSGLTFCRAWSGSKLFAKVISRWH